jgi:opacity protein-like surface antigen
MSRSRRVASALCGVAAAFALCTSATAQSHAGDFDYYGSIGWIAGESGSLSRFSNVHADIDGTWLYGFGLGYHMTDQWSVLFDIAFGYPNLTLHQAGTPSIGQSADYFNGRLNLEYTPVPSILEPIVSGGIGFNNFRTAIPGAIPQVFCTPGFFYWWCATGVPTYDETSFAWNLGAGFRLQITPVVFAKLMYQATWSDYAGLRGTRQFNQVMLQFGATFRMR